MKDLFFGENSLTSRAGELTEKGLNAVQTLREQNIWDVLAKLIPQEWNDAWDAFKMKMLIWLLIIVGLFILISLCSQAIKRIIRGLDIAAVGGLLVWLGTKVPDIVFVRDLEKTLMMIGIGLLVFGLAIFVISRFVAGKIKNREKAKFEAKVNQRVEEELKKREKELLANAQKFTETKNEAVKQIQS